MINKEIFELILNKIKILKCEIIYITNGVVYGTDCKFNTLTEYVDSGIDPNIRLAFKLSDLKNISKSEYIISGNMLIFETSRVNLIDVYYINNIMPLIYSVNGFRNRNFICHFDNIKDDFEQAFQLKSNQRAIYINIAPGGYVISLYAGLIPNNKADKVELNVYGIDNISFISEFTIKKSKNVSFKKYIKYLLV